MGSRYLIIDIGEEDGRHILGSIEDGKLKLEEVHRFDTTYSDNGGMKCWNPEHLFREVKAGLIKCREIDKLPIFVGVASWEDDFVLLDNEGKIIGEAVISHNTIDRLKAIKEHNPDELDKAENLLMIADYINFLLTGRKSCEFSNAITSQLVDWETKDWDEELIQMQGLPRKIFTTISQPGTIIGNLTLEVTEEVGYDCIIVQPASRKAGSAIMKIPNEDKNLQITSQLRAPAGNLMVLMISSHEIADFVSARECLRKTFEVIK